jgi:hypothetical protein
VEMEKGYFDNGMWNNGVIRNVIFGATAVFKLGKKVIAFRCPNCKKIELYTEEK